MKPILLNHSNSHFVCAVAIAATQTNDQENIDMSMFYLAIMTLLFCSVDFAILSYSFPSFVNLFLEEET